MPPIVSELIKFTLAHGFKLDSPVFAQLRNVAVANGVKEQYYGTCTDTPNTLFWVIRPLESPVFRNAVKALDVEGKPENYYLPFAHDSLPRPLSLPSVRACEPSHCVASSSLTDPLQCFLHIKSTADQKSLAYSLNKTFTDCYYAEGFTGGHWSTASNDDKMNYYYLGWESRDFHRAFTKTDLFALELNNLMPHRDGGGANFMKMTQQLN
ncbi:hypothetical protein BS47DRAFT_310816 [Hydnum rufescens UP504]|uniref:Uncharacterized protein n=1 Tax=Hydnum rufescens UP504 TaxID=1448309 RepID=A0A9P6DRC6_9AGAM|nr:hypothetical protein BS47DRAFT_310816 [Hydnum rufescens UP504]